MTEYEAREAIKPKLIFGNDRQIRAIRFLDAVQEAVDVILESPECEECGGFGKIEKFCGCGHDEDCDVCDGDGFNLEQCSYCDGLGYFIIDWPVASDDVLQAAKNRIKQRNGDSRWR